MSAPNQIQTVNITYLTAFRCFLYFLPIKSPQIRNVRTKSNTNREHNIFNCISMFSLFSSNQIATNPKCPNPEPRKKHTITVYITDLTAFRSFLYFLPIKSPQTQNVRTPSYEKSIRFRRSKFFASWPNLRFAPPPNPPQARTEGSSAEETFVIASCHSWFPFSLSMIKASRAL